MINDTDTDVFWAAELDRLRAKVGPVALEEAARRGAGARMLDRARQLVDDAEESLRLLDRFWLTSYDPIYDDRDEEEGK